MVFASIPHLFTPSILLDLLNTNVRKQILFSSQPAIFLLTSVYCSVSRQPSPSILGSAKGRRTKVFVVWLTGRQERWSYCMMEQNHALPLPVYLPTCFSPNPSRYSQATRWKPRSRIASLCENLLEKDVVITNITRCCLFSLCAFLYK